MTEDDLRQAVIDAIVYVAPETDPLEIDPSSNLAEQLDLDSMDILNIVVALHERTGVDIPERAYSSLSTVDSAVAYLLEHA